MKNRLQYISLIIFLSFSGLMISCKKSFLEITPKGSLIASQTSDYNLLLNDPGLRSVSEMNGQVIMGDEMAAVEPYISGSEARNHRFFKWEDDIYTNIDADRELAISMRHIYTYNKVINEVGESEGGTDAQKSALEAEARAGRAWTYFMLIQYYGKPYDPATAASDPGYPIITATDVTETKFNRASVKEVYDFIVNDLTYAVANVPAQMTHRFRVSRSAAEGLLGKVYMFMGKFNEALPLLNAAFSDLSGSLVPVRLYDYNVAFGTGGSFLPIGINGPVYPADVSNEEVIYSKTIWNDWQFRNSEFVINPQTVALYKSSDQRLRMFSTKASGGSTNYPAGMMRRIGGTNFPQAGVILPELYLLRAETKARLNDLAGAKADVEALRVKRMPAADAPVPAAIASNQQELVKFILQERIREFAAQGFRWFDMRRLSVDPIYKTTVDYTHHLYSASGTTTSFTLKPERFVLRFSPKLMEQNPEMNNNP